MESVFIFTVNCLLLTVICFIIILVAKKRMRSIWVVILTALVTILVAGSAVAGYFYWRDNFVKPKEVGKTENKTPEQKIEGKNLVILTIGNENLVLNFLNLGSKSIIKKQVKTESLPRGGKWAESEKNALVQFDNDGKITIFAESKDTGNDESSSFKFIRTDYLGKESETLLEKNSASLLNFLFKDEKIFYLNSKSAGEESLKVNLLSLDLKTKKEETLAQNVGDFFQKELEYNGGKIYSLYKTQDSKFYEVSVDEDSKSLEKKLLFAYKKNKENELNPEDIYPSPSHQQFLFKDYSLKEGYTLKIYNLNTKKTATLIKDKNYSFDKVYWLSEEEIAYVKNPVVSSPEEEVTKNEIVKINLKTPNAEEAVASSSNVLIPLFFVSDESVYLEDKNIVYTKGSEKKDFQIEGLMQASDILGIGIFDY